MWACSSDAIHAVDEELTRARAKHGPMHGPHEGYAVILEELDELWEEVRAQDKERNVARMRCEAIQVAAMAVRFVEDVCGGMPQ